MIRYSHLLVFTVLLLICGKSNALTVKQFRSICDSHEQCDQLPVIQAYVGGALDLFATLDERSNYLSGINCPAARKKYDVTKITEFMLQQPSHEDVNAMTLFVKYFEKHGGCQ